MSWVSIHRCHHRYVDTERDPHSPIQGLWFSHIAWLFDSHTLNKKVCPKYFSDTQKQGTKMYKTFFKQGNPSNVSDLEKQTFYRFIQKSYIFHPMALGVLFYAIGGAPLFLWAMVTSNHFFYLSCLLFLYYLISIRYILVSYIL